MNRGYVRKLDFGDRGHVKCAMGPKLVSGEGHFLCLGGFSGGLFASNVTQMAVISDWNDSYGSMRPRGHVRHLDFGDGGMPSAQCVQNSRWRGSFFLA